MGDDTAGIHKPTPAEWFSVPEHGENSNVETRLSQMPGYITPNNRFYVRSHDPTPTIDGEKWRLAVGGDAVEKRLELSLRDLQAMPQTSITRAIECAGNARVFFERQYGQQAGGAQWGPGAIGVAQWTGVRLREVLDRAGVTADAVDVLPEGLDEIRFSRPLPIAKAMADDTLIALAMNGESLPADHGYPARLVVSGWLGAASVKWLGNIEVATRALHTYWNTRDYTLAGPDYPAEPPADGLPITLMPVMSIIEMDWNARKTAGEQVIRGRAFSGEGRISRVEYAIDDGDWQPAHLEQPNMPAAWVRWRVHWQAEAGDRLIRIRATDEQGNTQPESIPWNDHGCLYNAVVAYPVRITA